VNSREADLEEDEIKRRVERRFREVVALVRHTGATDEADAAIDTLPVAEPDATLESATDEDQPPATDEPLGDSD
jgi:hypothetical protein